MSELSDAEVRLAVARLAGMARAGAGDGAIAREAVYLSGEKMIPLYAADTGERVDVRVERVRSVGPHWNGGTVLVFNGLPDHHPKAQLVVIDELHDVVRKLHEKGWQE
jgi:hypothetical protein